MYTFKILNYNNLYLYNNVLLLIFSRVFEHKIILVKAFTSHGIL